MKKTILATALAFLLVAGTSFAHQMPATTEGDQTWQGRPGMMMGKGDGMKGFGGQGHGMMGKHTNRMGMMGKQGQCMMGRGMHGAGMMGSHHGMMGGGMNGSGMMRGYHGMMDPAQLEKRDTFLDATKGLRKNIHDKHFEYMEASRNKEETVGSLREREKELSTLQQELQIKREEFFTNK